MPGIIVKAITIEQIIALAPPVIYYSTLTAWWTHERLHLSRHPDTKLPCDPRGAMLYETKHVMEWFRKARLNAREGVYGKHGLDAFIAAHHLNCLISETDRRSTCFTTWKEYSDTIERQNAVPVPAPILRNADLSLGPIPEKTIMHDPNPRVMGRDEGGDEGEFEDDDDEAETAEIEIVATAPAPEPTPVVEAPEAAAVAPASGTVQAGPDTKIPVQTSPLLQTLIDKNIKKDARQKNR